MVMISGGYQKAGRKIKLKDRTIVQLNDEGGFDCPKDEVDRFKQAGYSEVVSPFVKKEKSVESVEKEIDVEVEVENEVKKEEAEEEDVSKKSSKKKR